jgi:ABC-type multidrug transport system permease subunit
VFFVPFVVNYISVLRLGAFARDLSANCHSLLRMSNEETNAEPTHRYWPLGQLILARVREFVREPEAMFWVYGFPILMTIGLGVAFRNQPVEKIVVAVVEGPYAAATEEALHSTNDTTRFEAEVFAADDARRRLRTGRADVVVTQQRADGRPEFVYAIDPTRSESVLARSAVDDQLQRAAGRTDVAEVELVEVSEPGSRYIDFLVPGLLGMSLMGGGLWGVGFVTVDMRVRKLLKRFLATPMKKRDFMLGIMISRMLFMVPEVLALLVFARYAFGVVNHGTVTAVTLLILLGATMFSGIGLLIASRAKTIEAISGMMNLIMVPMWIFSGIFFSPERFPAALQPIVQALPLTPLISTLRAVMQEGKSLAELATPLGVMAAWAVVSFVLALKWFRWR